ncbi:tyrosine recombinase XerC [Pigmentiphaga humi]|nr:tyrosine recombinase XerC [Pigmentiphaga humi]
MGEWLGHLESGRRYSVHTLAAYRRDLGWLVELADGLPLEHVSQGHVRRYLGLLHAQGLSPRSLARILATWRGFYQWWAPRAGMAANPAAGVRGPKVPRGLPKALSVDQTQALLDHEPPQAGEQRGQTDAQRCAIALRDTAMFELFYSSGLRLAELVGLDTAYVRAAGYESASWLDLEQAEVSVLGKGGKRRIVPVGSQACTALRAWLEARPVLAAAAGADVHALFLGLRGRRVSTRVVQAQLARRGQSAGVPTHVHPHVLRHSFASHVLQSAEDLRAVQEMLGHANISTTQIYTRLDFQHLAKVYDKAHPRAGRDKKNPHATPSAALPDGKKPD